MKDRYKFFIAVGVFAAAYFIPFGDESVKKAILEAFTMIQDYAQKHVLLCLVPAFFIAGAIAVFVSQASVMKYLGPQANKFLSYSVASVSGTILAVCSCTVLPLFAGIYRMGAGIGPATAFLYSGPAINVLAIVLSAKVLGWQIGLARAVGSVGFAYVIGLAMAFIFRNDADQQLKNNYLKVKLNGANKNTDGYGAKVYVYNKNQQQYLEQMPARGFQSTMSAVLHFGLGAAACGPGTKTSPGFPG